MSSNDSNQDVVELFQSPDRKLNETKGTGGILAKLWRSILFEQGIPLRQFEYLCTQFVIHARRGITDTKVANYFNRGNLRRELMKPAMSFKVFMKALRVLQVVKFDLSVKLYFRTGKTSIHNVTVDLSTPHEFDTDD